jgi:hypothetical protein
MLERLHGATAPRPELDGADAPTFPARDDIEAGYAIVRSVWAFAADPAVTVVRLTFEDGDRYLSRADAYEFMAIRSKGGFGGDTRLAGRGAGPSPLLELRCTACGHVNRLAYVPTEDDLPACQNPEGEPHTLALRL